jgi:flavin reductase (DIM6/NTAB) family NADH-FMN oxidoreductase RutF
MKVAQHTEQSTAEMRDVDADRFRSVMGHFATGVTVVTASAPDGPVGLTANAVASLSLDPLLLLVAFDNEARTLPVIRETGRFGVNVLHAGSPPSGPSGRSSRAWPTPCTTASP